MITAWRHFQHCAHTHTHTKKTRRAFHFYIYVRVCSVPHLGLAVFPYNSFLTSQHLLHNESVAFYISMWQFYTYKHKQLEGCGFLFSFPFGCAAYIKPSQNMCCFHHLSFIRICKWTSAWTASLLLTSDFQNLYMAAVFTAVFTKHSHSLPQRAVLLYQCHGLSIMYIWQFYSTVSK